MSLKHPPAYNETLYKQYRNMTTRLLRIEEKQYYQSQIDANRDNILDQIDSIILIVIVASQMIQLSQQMLLTISSWI